MCKKWEFHIQHTRGLLYAIGLSLNVGYMALPLDVAMPFGLFQYLILQQGIKPTIDVFQAWITTLFVLMHKKVPKCYLDYVLCTQGKTFKIVEILQWMQNAQLQVNGGKSKWSKKEVKVLGFMLMPMEYKPIKKCIDAILAISQPRNLCKLHRYIGCINFIRKHIPREQNYLSH